VVSRQGVRNQHQSCRPDRRAGYDMRCEIKRNKAHGGCLGIERR
jgi:hypothetical protein